MNKLALGFKSLEFGNIKLLAYTTVLIVLQVRLLCLPMIMKVGFAINVRVALEDAELLV